MGKVKKLLIAGALIVSLCLSAFAGHYISEQNTLKDRDNKSRTLIKLAIAKVEDLKNGYDADTMEALISNVYAAVQFTDNGELYSALHELWNALIFSGENIAGKENELIKALKDADTNVIEGIAYSISQAS
jgi:hypothetical protein